jgi:hypothetical protein
VKEKCGLDAVRRTVKQPWQIMRRRRPGRHASSLPPSGGTAASSRQQGWLRLCKLCKFHNKRLALSRAVHRDDLRAAELFSDTFYNYAQFDT